MHNLDQIIDRLLKANELDIYEGRVADRDIEELCRATQCVLTEDYIEFLKRCGFASWEGHSVYGIFDANDERFPKSYNYSASQQTARARQLCAALPYPSMDSSVVIGKDGMGGFFLLLSKAINSKQDVIWINKDDDWVISKRWESFALFLEYLLSD